MEASTNTMLVDIHVYMLLLLFVNQVVLLKIVETFFWCIHAHINTFILKVVVLESGYKIVHVWI